jgi:hypothetical protein
MNSQPHAMPCYAMLCYALPRVPLSALPFVLPCPEYYYSLTCTILCTQQELPFWYLKRCAAPNSKAVEASKDHLDVFASLLTPPSSLLLLTAQTFSN